MSTLPRPEDATTPASDDASTDTLEMSILDLAAALGEDGEGFPESRGDDADADGTDAPASGGDGQDQDASYFSDLDTTADDAWLVEDAGLDASLFGIEVDGDADGVGGETPTEAPSEDGEATADAWARDPAEATAEAEAVWNHAATYEAEPTAVSMPVIGLTTEAVVLDESAPGVREAAALRITPRRAKVALGVLAAAAFAAGTGEGAVVALTPAIATGLSVPVATVGLLATAFALTVVVSAVPLTLATKRMSRRIALTAALGVWTAGMVVTAAATSIEMLAAGRVFSAGAHALFWAMVAPMAASLFAPHLRARSVTGIMLGSAAAGVLGTPLVTTLGNQVGWQAPFIGLAVLGAALTVGLATLLPSSRGAAAAPAVLGDIPHKRAFARVLAVGFLVAVAMSTTWTYVVPYYTQVSGLPSGTVPLLFALGGALAVAATLAISPFLARHAVRTVAVGTAALTLGWVMLGLQAPWSAIAAQVLLSSGWAVLVAALLNWAMRHAPWRTEIAGGVYTSTANAGSALGPVLGAGVVSAWSTAWLPWVSLVLTAIAGLVVATVDRRTLAALAVPRQVRVARRNLVAVQRRRRQWRAYQRELVRADREEAVRYRIEAQRRMADQVPRDIALDRALHIR